ncbi:MAG: hypothetical protein HC887_07775 [Desulfobacteraceae bacterium]|nr:hypothetical protein [Desulfobacteraceae bacterium]
MDEIKDLKTMTFFKTDIKYYAYALLILLISASASAQTPSIGLFIGDVDAYVCMRALESENLPKPKFGFSLDADTGSKDMS